MTQEHTCSPCPVKQTFPQYSRPPAHTPHGQSLDQQQQFVWAAWTPGNPTSAVTQAKAPHIQQAWTNGQSVARQQMTQKQGNRQLHQLEKQCAHPAKELTCILIPSRPRQHRNKRYLFRVSSKHLLSQTNDFFLIANENK